MGRTSALDKAFIPYISTYLSLLAFKGKPVGNETFNIIAAQYLCMTNTSDWPHPDHYIELECPECKHGHATAARSLDKALGIHCFECGTEMHESDIIGRGPDIEKA